MTKRPRASATTATGGRDTSAMIAHEKPAPRRRGLSYTSVSFKNGRVTLQFAPGDDGKLPPPWPGLDRRPPPADGQRSLKRLESGAADGGDGAVIVEEFS